MSNGSSPDDLSELLDDIASVNDIEDGLISVDGDDYQDSFNEPSHPNTAERQLESNYRGFANNPPNTIDIQKGVYSNPTAVSAPIMSAQDTSELLSSILSSISSAEGNVSGVGFNLLPHIHTGLNNNFTATQPHFGPTDEISPNLFHSNNVLPLSVDNLNTSQENFNNLSQDPGTTCTNEQNSSPKSPSGKTIAGNNDSQEKISIINNFIDWDKLKPALIETKKSRKTTPKPEKEPKTIVPDFISGPVKLFLPDIKKFLRSLKRSRKTTKKIQDWDRLMGLKKCHSRTMTKTAASRKRLLQIMQDIAVHANEGKSNVVATKAA